VLFSLKRSFRSLTYLLRSERALPVCFAFVCVLSSSGCALPTYQTLLSCPTGVCHRRPYPGLAGAAGRLPHAGRCGSPHHFRGFFCFFSPSCLEQLNFCPEILHAYSLGLRILQSTYSLGISRSKHSLKIKRVCKCLASLGARQPVTLPPHGFCERGIAGQGRRGRVPRGLLRGTGAWPRGVSRRLCSTAAASCLCTDRLSLSLTSRLVK